jgi:hypothetical protein
VTNDLDVENLTVTPDKAVPVVDLTVAVAITAVAEVTLD